MQFAETGSPTGSLTNPFWIRQTRQWGGVNINRAALPSPLPLIAAATKDEGPNCLFRIPSSPLDPEGKFPASSAPTYWFGDALLMKSMGGAPKHYMAWIPAAGGIPDGHWDYVPQNSVDPNVVREFCSCSAIPSCQR
jgi:hypothetical protein